MSERPEPPPEGALITEALERIRPKLSVRAAAPRAGIGEARWRQIVKGYTTVSGSHVHVHGPPETVARMAQVVGVTPEQLIEAGREDAAEELRRLPAAADSPEPDLAEQLAERLRWFEEDNARRQRENEERMRQLEDEVKRLREQRSG